MGSHLGCWLMDWMLSPNRAHFSSRSRSLHPSWNQSACLAIIKAQRLWCVQCFSKWGSQAVFHVQLQSCCNMRFGKRHLPKSTCICKINVPCIKMFRISDSKLMTQNARLAWFKPINIERKWTTSCAIKFLSEVTSNVSTATSVLFDSLWCRYGWVKACSSPTISCPLLLCSLQWCFLCYLSYANKQTGERRGWGERTANALACSSVGGRRWTSDGKWYIRTRDTASGSILYWNVALVEQQEMMRIQTAVIHAIQQ